MKTDTYQKADSFLDVRHRSLRHQEVRDRVAVHCRAKQEHPDTNAALDASSQACSDLLADNESDTGIRFALSDNSIQDIMLIPDALLDRFLAYRYRYEMFPSLKRVDRFPPCIQVEPASVCNYRCVFCFQTDASFSKPGSGHMGFMSVELFRRIIDQAEGNCEAVTLASRGEPLLNPRIAEMLRYAGGKFLALKLNTNASVLTEPLCHAILESGVNTLVFSVDAASEPLYSTLRKGGNLERVLTNIRRFQDIRTKQYRESKIVTRVSGVKYSEDQHLADLEAFWADLVDQVAFVRHNPWENTYDKQPNDVAEACSDLWRRMFVWYDGTVNPCDIDYKSKLAVGDANTESLTDIWTGPQYTALREAHLAGNRGAENLCSRCTFV
jgi:radical SAM protein with 4Fe4S-binding SPASM domain